MRNVALIVASLALFAGVSGCISSPVGLLDLADAGFDSAAELVAVDAKVSARSDDPDPCPDLSDPSADPNVYACQLLARLRYLINETDCDEYIAEHNACTIN